FAEELVDAIDQVVAREPQVGIAILEDADAEILGLDGGLPRAMVAAAGLVDRVLDPVTRWRMHTLIEQAKHPLDVQHRGAVVAMPVPVAVGVEGVGENDAAADLP